MWFTYFQYLWGRQYVICFCHLFKFERIKKTIVLIKIFLLIFRERSDSFMRKLQGLSLYVCFSIGVFLSGFSIYTAAFGVFAPFIQRGIHVGCLLPMGFMLCPATKKSPKDRITVLDAIWAVFSFLPCLYVVLNKRLLESRLVFVSSLEPIQLILGLILIVCFLEIVRRSVTPVMTGLAVIGLVYLFVGPYLPKLLAHKGLSIERIVESCYLLTDQGIFGSLMGTSATFIIIFIIFGEFAVATGVGQFFIDFSRALFGSARGGSAKISILSAGLFGTMTGSAVATVYTTGTFTIPLMKKSGFTDEFSGAVSAAASTGGQIMPPIMGATAFLLAENLSMPYSAVAIKASIVAILYYFSLFAMVHCKCLREGISGESRENLPRFMDIVRQSYLAAPILILLTMLLRGSSILLSGLIGILACIVVSMFKKENRMTISRILNALYKSAQGGIMICAALGGAGLIVIAVTYSGLALSFSSLVISLSHGSLFISLLLVAIACIILGMGVPSTAAYVIVSALGARLLIKLGVTPFAAHMFVLYFAIISNITPPVAVAAYAAANISKANAMKTGVTASILAVVAYVVPFIAAYNPLLLLEGGDAISIAWATATAFLGVFILAGAIQGWFVQNLNIPFRMLVGASGLLLLHPNTHTDLISIFAISVIFGYIKYMWKPKTQIS